MSNIQTTSPMGSPQSSSKDPDWWKKYKPAEWEDLEEDLALEAMAEVLEEIKQKRQQEAQK